MPAITPDEGLEFVKDKMLAKSSVDGWRIYQVGVGEGTVALDPSDTQLDQEVYRASVDESSVTFADDRALITVEGGQQVPPGTNITEIGLWAIDPDDPPGDDSKDVMMCRVSLQGVEIDDGDWKTFEIPYEVLPR